MSLAVTASGRNKFGPGINAEKSPCARPITILNPHRTLHDPSTYWDNKMDRSSPFFRETRVQTCAHVKSQINGKSYAVGFPLKKTGWKAPNSFQNQ